LDAKFRSEKGQTRNQSTQITFFNEQHHSMKTQKSHTKEFEITTTPQVGTLVTTNCLNKKRTRLNFGL